MLAIVVAMAAAVAGVLWVVLEVAGAVSTTGENVWYIALGVTIVAVAFVVIVTARSRTRGMIGLTVSMSVLLVAILLTYPTDKAACTPGSGNNAATTRPRERRRHHHRPGRRPDERERLQVRLAASPARGGLGSRARRRSDAVPAREGWRASTGLDRTPRFLYCTDQSTMGRTSDARSRLIESAFALWFRRSYADVGVSEICAAAGVQKGSFYHFFPSKTDLAVAVVDEVEQQFRTEVAGPYLNNPDVPRSSVSSG